MVQKTIYTEDHRRLCAKLREIRQDAGLTQVELAMKLGVTQSFVAKAERGERRLDMIQLRTICRALKVKMSEVVREFD